MPGTPGTTSLLAASPGFEALRWEDEPHPGASLTDAPHLAVLAAATERDRFDAFDCEVFGLDRSTPAPVERPCSTLAATPSAAAFDAFDREVFGLTR